MINLGDTVAVRVHGDRDCEASVVAVHEDDVLDVRIGDKRPIKVRRSDTPAPFTWRPA